jgi:hypothetical protein
MRDEVKKVANGEAFTTESVVALLRDEVLKDDKPLPGRAGLERLVIVLNTLQQVARASLEPFPEDPEPERLKRIGQAINVLTQDLPAQLLYYAAALRVFMKKQGMSEEEIANSWSGFTADLGLHHFSALVAAARRAGVRDLPSVINTMYVPVKRWKYFRRDLESMFRAVLPDGSDEALYRFIKAVIPGIMDEHPTIGAIKKETERDAAWSRELKTSAASGRRAHAKLLGSDKREK